MHNLTKNTAALCHTITEAVREDGTLNVTRAARMIGLGQSTLLKILRDESGQARPSTEEKLITFFGITKDQLYSPNFDPSKPDDRVDKILAEIDMLSAVDRMRMYEALGIDIEIKVKKP